jgi:hypothetical protein
MRRYCPLCFPNTNHPTLTPSNSDHFYISVQHMHVENEPPRNTFRDIVSAHLRLRCDYLLHDRRMSEPYESITFQKKGNGLYTIRGCNKPLELLLLPVILQGKYGNVYGLWHQATVLIEA